MASILKSITDALGETSDETQEERINRRQEAIVYILSEDFKLDMEAIGYLHRVEKIRRRIIAETYRTPLGYQDKVDKYRRPELAEVDNGIRI